MEAPERIHVPLDDVQNMGIPLKSLSGEPRSVEYTRSDTPHLPEEIVERVRRTVEIDNAEWAEFRSQPGYSKDQEPYITTLLRDILATIDGEEG